MTKEQEQLIEQGAANHAHLRMMNRLQARQDFIDGAAWALTQSELFKQILSDLLEFIDTNYEGNIASTTNDVIINRFLSNIQP